jgi:hypothetical protein
MRMKNMAADELVDPTCQDIRLRHFVRGGGRRCCFRGLLPAGAPHAGPLSLPPEDFFHDPATLVADIWTLGVSPVRGGPGRARPLFEAFGGDPDEVLADMVSERAGAARWWERWEENRANSLTRTGPGCARPGGSLPRAMEEILGGMLAYEPAERLMAEQLVE